jgi:predicted nucleic acid-binding protein
MTQVVVVDASVVVAALVDGGPDGRWSEAVLVADQLAAPHLLPVEVTNILRRAVSAKELSEDTNCSPTKWCQRVYGNCVRR